MTDTSNPPPNIARLPKDARGYHVPWFVQWFDGVPEFRIMDQLKWIRAVKEKLCWICGKPLGGNLAFTIGPMCAVNRTTAEPPSHLICATYSVRACPFLSNPNFERRETDDIKDKSHAGIMIKRNPGVTLIWLTRKYKVFTTETGPLIELADPVATLWYREGRSATREEILEAFNSGLPILRASAEQDPHPGALAFLDEQVKRAMTLIQV